MPSLFDGPYGHLLRSSRRTSPILEQAMTITANDVARAIVAGAKETGADPIDAALGNDRAPGCYFLRAQKISRARAYAGRALDRFFNHPVVTVARPLIAKLIGVNKPSYGSFFGSLDARPLPWWSPEAYQRVISAVEAGLVRQQSISAPVVTPSPKRSIGTLENGGFRPAPGTYEKVLDADKSESRFSGPYVPVGRPAPRKEDDFLRRAVENTQKMTPPPED